VVELKILGGSAPHTASAKHLERLAAKLAKVIERLSAGAANMERPGADLIAFSARSSFSRVSLASLRQRPLVATDVSHRPERCLCGKRSPGPVCHVAYWLITLRVMSRA
jgi:hypothetical protein